LLKYFEEWFKDLRMGPHIGYDYFSNVIRNQERSFNNSTQTLFVGGMGKLLLFKRVELSGAYNYGIIGKSFYEGVRNQYQIGFGWVKRNSRSFRVEINKIDYTYKATDTHQYFFRTDFIYEEFF
jgi:hypothetical protein